MRFLRWAALILAITAGYLGAPGGRASAAALPIAGLAASEAKPVVEQAQWRRVYRPRYHRARFYRPRYYPARYYRPRYYRPRVVCRVRYGYYGPRRVCFRRY